VNHLKNHLDLRQNQGIGGRVKFLPLAWAGMPKTSFRKNSDSPLGFLKEQSIHYAAVTIQLLKIIET
jgi:hypothetical protein